MASFSFSERHLFYALLVFWLVGVLLLIVQHPYDCKYFDLPANGRITPTNPNELPVSDAWFRLTHHMTLTPYAILCVFLQLLLFFGWYLQVSAHAYLQSRLQIEAGRGAAMRQYGWGRCLRSVLRDSDRELELDTLPPDAQRCECVCGCCALFSTSCALWLLNALAVTLLVFMLLFGLGSLESANRFNQNASCRAGLTAGYYIYALNVALLLLYLVLLLARAMCTAGTVVTRAVELGKRVHNRVQTRKGLRNPKARAKAKGPGGAGGASAARGNTKPSNPAYAQLDANVELGLELSDDENDLEYGHDDADLESGQMELEDSVADSLFGIGDVEGSSSDEEEFHSDRAHEPNGRAGANGHGHGQQSQPQSQAQAQVQPLPPAPTAVSLAQPKPQRPAAAGKLFTSPPTAGDADAGPSSPTADAAAPVDSGDADTREMLEMLDAGGEDADQSPDAAALQQQAEDALRELEEEQAQLDGMP